MTKDDTKLLFEYDRWANNRVLRAAATLTVEQFTRNLGGSFPSVRDALLHIIAGEWIWLQYWKETTPDPAFLPELRKRRDALFHPDVFADVTAVRSRWAEVEEEMAGFVNGLTDEDLKKMLPARNTLISLAHLMQHVANHSTYHRGQVALMMRQLGAEPLATDFHVFLAEGRARAGA